MLGKIRGSLVINYGKVNLLTDAGEQQARFLQNFISNKKDDEYVFFARKDSLAENGWRQEGFLVKDLRGGIAANNIAATGDDAYVAANSFRSPAGRSSIQISNFTACYQDLDYQKEPAFADKSAEEMKDLVLEDCVKYAIPKPSLVVATGHGLHLWWMLEPIDTRFRSSWETVQSSLQRAFAKYGADAFSIDAARVLRLPGTYNAKDGNDKTPVSLLWQCDRKLVKFSTLHNWMRRYETMRWLRSVRDALPDAYAAIPLFQLDMMLNEGRVTLPSRVSERPLLLPLAPDKITPAQPERCARKRARKNETVEECCLRHSAAAKSVALNRAFDIETLVRLRGGNVKGMRDNILFMLNAFLLHAHFSAQKRFSELSAVNRSFIEPLSEKEVSSICYKTKLNYAPANTTIIRKLAITSEEQSVLKTILSPEEKRRRAVLLNKTGVDRETYRETTIQTIVELLSEGMSVSAIAKKIGRSRVTVYNWIKRFGLSRDGLVRCARARGEAKKNPSAAAASEAKRYARETVRKLHACVDATDGHVHRDAEHNTKRRESRHLARALQKTCMEKFWRLVEDNVGVKPLLRELESIVKNMAQNHASSGRKSVKISYATIRSNPIWLAYLTYIGPQYGKDCGKTMFSSLLAGTAA